MRPRRRAFRLSLHARRRAAVRPPSVAARWHSAPWSGCTVMLCGVWFNHRACVCRHRIEQAQRRVQPTWLRACRCAACCRCAVAVCWSPPRIAHRSALVHSDRVSPSIRASSCNVTARPIALTAQRRHRQGNGQPTRPNRTDKQKEGDEPTATTTTQRDQHVQHPRKDDWKISLIL